MSSGSPAVLAGRARWLAGIVVVVLTRNQLQWEVRKRRKRIWIEVMIRFRAGNSSLSTVIKAHNPSKLPTGSQPLLQPSQLPLKARFLRAK